MSDTYTLHTALLRPAIIHILRAQGFYSTRPSVLDTLTDLCARHLLLLAQRTAYSVYARTSHNPDSPGPIPPLGTQDASELAPTKADLQAPTLTDIRHALQSTYFFPSALTAGEEAWREVLRKPLSAFPAGAAREKERQRRDAEDTRDVREFIDWCTGPANREIRRIAGVLEDGEDEMGGMGDLMGPVDGTVGHEKGSPGPGVAKDGQVLQSTAKARKDDYVAALKKKHSKTGDGARYAGTALGKLSEDRGAVRIEGGPETLEAWGRGLKRKQVDIGS